VVSLLLTLVAATAGSVGGIPAGTPIVSITVEAHNVFDTSEPGTSAWPYRAANALHVVSRERFIRSLLLFKVGDPLDPHTIAESERLLRATGFMNPVEIRVHRADGGAAVVVVTHDQWTLDLELNYGVVGSRRKSGIAATEDNFLGWGKSVQVVYRSDVERDSVTLAYMDPLLAGTRWQLQASHREASDGNGDTFSLVYPFFALGTPRAGGVEWANDTLREWLYAGGHRAVSGDAAHRSLRLWGGAKLPGRAGVTNRLTVGFFVDRSRFSDWHYRDGSAFAAPADRRLQGVELGWQHEVDRWKVVHGFRAWVRQEDVPLGPNWDVRLGVSLPAFGGDRPRLRVDSDFLAATLRGPWYSWLQGGLTGRFEHGDLDNGVLHLEIGSARTGAVGFRGRIAADVSRNLDRDRQLTLGADTGLRGWDPDFFDGTSRLVGNFEYRHQLTGEVLHLFVLGATAFADVGRTWYPRIGASTDGWRGDVGLGLQAEITRAAILHVVRLEVAYPDDGSGPVFLATGQSLF
jgi:hypothetical protein